MDEELRKSFICVACRSTLDEILNTVSGEFSQGRSDTHRKCNPDSRINYWFWLTLKFFFISRARSNHARDMFSWNAYSVPRLSKQIFLINETYVRYDGWLMASIVPFTRKFNKILLSYEIIITTLIHSRTVIQSRGKQSFNNSQIYQFDRFFFNGLKKLLI